MEPQKKAEQLIKIFGKNLAYAYVMQLVQDAPMQSGDYQMMYEHEWREYQSYWDEVTKFLKPESLCKFENCVRKSTCGDYCSDHCKCKKSKA